MWVRVDIILQKYHRLIVSICWRAMKITFICGTMFDLHLHVRLPLRDRQILFAR